jgi:nickel-dependent lactate racemase
MVPPKSLRRTLSFNLLWMRLAIPYGKEQYQDLVVPDANFAGCLLPNDVGQSDEDRAIREALDNPIDGVGLERFMAGSQNAVFIVNDATRPTPTSRVLDFLAERVRLQNHRFLIATGSHRAPSNAELEFIFGERVHLLRPNIHAHDAKKDKMELLGKTKRGTEIWINAIAADAERIVIITSVEPHYFAGYTGGRKSIMPGVAAYSTIEQNHRWAMGSDATTQVLGGNPVHEDMVDAIKLLQGKPIFSIQLVLDRHMRVHRAAAGDLNACFDRAVSWADEVFSVPIKKKADVVVTVARYPLDIDLYQSQKAIDNAKWALNDGGTIILVSPCRTGIGEPAFHRQLAASADPERVLRNLEAEYHLGDHKAAKVALIMRNALVWGVTALPPDDLMAINIQPFGSVQAAVDAALERRPDAQVLVMLDGGMIVPKVG